MKTMILILIALLTFQSCRKDEGRPQHIVMLGDSMTRRANINSDWSVLLNEDVTNLGIDGLKSSGVINNTLPTALELNPTVVYLMIGFNDADNIGFNLGNTIKNITTICETLEAKHIQVVIQSVLPPTKEYNETIGNNTTKENIDSINNNLIELCQIKGYKFIDVRDVLTDGDYLIDDYSVDGVHLNPTGYLKWANYL